MVNTFLQFIQSSTIGLVVYSLVSKAKEAINVDNLVPDLVDIIQYLFPAANVKFLEANDCTLTEAYKLSKNVQFHDDRCSIQAYIKKRSSSDLEAIINCTHLIIA